MSTDIKPLPQRAPNAARTPAKPTLPDANFPDIPAEASPAMRSWYDNLKIVLTRLHQGHTERLDAIDKKLNS